MVLHSIRRTARRTGGEQPPQKAVVEGLRAEPDLLARVLPDGRLDLFSPRTGIRHRCGPLGTSMWIALQQNDWDPGRAAAELAPLWGGDEEAIRAELNGWVGEFLAAGLLTFRPH
ncbi:PqqD family protein [Streptomyces roseifaciens]